MNPKTGVIEAIPRHKEIKEPLAKKILKGLDAEQGKSGSEQNGNPAFYAVVAEVPTTDL